MHACAWLIVLNVEQDECVCEMREMASTPMDVFVKLSSLYTVDGWMDGLIYYSKPSLLHTAKTSLEYKKENPL